METFTLYRRASDELTYHRRGEIQAENVQAAIDRIILQAQRLPDRSITGYVGLVRGGCTFRELRACDGRPIIWEVLLKALRPEWQSIRLHGRRAWRHVDPRQGRLLPSF